MLYIFSVLKFIVTFLFLIIDLLKNVIVSLLTVIGGLFTLATGFCLEISIPIIIIAAVAVIYKIISLGGAGD